MGDHDLLLHTQLGEDDKAGHNEHHRRVLETGEEDDVDYDVFPNIQENGEENKEDRVGNPVAAPREVDCVLGHPARGFRVEGGAHAPRERDGETNPRGQRVRDADQLEEENENVDAVSIHPHMDHDVNSVHHNGPDPVVGPTGHMVSGVGVHRRASVNGSMVSAV